jgi:hypothetical protein
MIFQSQFKGCLSHPIFVVVMGAAIMNTYRNRVAGWKDRHAEMARGGVID